MGCASSNQLPKNKVDKDETEPPSFLSGVPVFNADDIDIGKYIAEGGHGKVYAGVNKTTGKQYALKFFGYTQRVSKMATIEAEIDLMQKLQGIEGVVEMVGVMIDSDEGLLPKRVSARPFPVIVMEMLSGGELYEHIADFERFSERNIAKIIKGVVITIQGMHDRKFLHRDVKLENLMFVNSKEDSTVKLIDFGLVVRLIDGSDVHKGKKAVGSPGYIAPESFKLNEYSPATDVWQIGCTLYMLLSGCLPFDPLHIEQVTENSYFPMTGIGWDNISNEAKDLVKKLLAKDPKKRICVRDILLHPWLVNDVPDEDLGVDYFARLKHLVLCQKLKGFFKDCNIKQDSEIRRSELIDEMPMFTFLDSDFENKLKVLKHSAVASFKRELSTSGEAPGEKTTGEINYETFKDLLVKANLAELGNKAVFSIFDTGNTGSVEMKDFLLTLIAFKLDEEPGESSDQSKSAIDDQCALYFHLFDIDDTGFIDEDELKLMTHILFKDQNVPGTQNANELFKLIDLDNNGQISYDEFKSFYAVVLATTIS